MVLKPGLSGIEHSALGFYGLDLGCGAFEKLYKEALVWFETLGCHPDLMGTSLDRGNVITFSRSHAKVVKAGFSNVDYVDVISLASGAKHQYQGRNVEIEVNMRSSFLCVSCRSSLTSREALLGVATRVADLVKPIYGIGFKRSCQFSERSTPDESCFFLAGFWKSRAAARGPV